MVMLTGEPSEDLAEHAIGSGFTDFIGKRNLSAEHLRQTLFNAVLKHRNGTHVTGSTNGHADAPADEPAELSQAERIELADALEVLDRAGLFDQARDDGEEVLQALRKLRDATTSMLVH